MFIWGAIMEDHEKMYTLLFNTITSALKQIDRLNIGNARGFLILGQKRAEDLYISSGGGEEPKED